MQLKGKIYIQVYGMICEMKFNLTFVLFLKNAFGTKILFLMILSPNQFVSKILQSTNTHIQKMKGDTYQSDGW